LLAAGLFAMSYMNSIWFFYLFLGVIMAIGINSIGFAVHNSYLPNWFVEKRGTAFGILMAGAGVANILVSQYQRLVITLGWRVTYQILAAITLVAILPVVIFLIRRTPQEKGLLPDGAVNAPGGPGIRDPHARNKSSLILDRNWVETEWTPAKALRTSRLWLMIFVQMFISISFNLVSAHQLVYTQDIGFDPIFAASIFGLSGAMSVVGNMFSFISDKLGREVAFSVGTAGGILGVTALIMANSQTPWLLYASAIVMGLFAGAGMPAMISGAADLFSGKHFGAINGFIIMGFGIGGAIGPWLGGYVYDTMGNYTNAFLATIIAQLIACALFWLAAPRNVRRVAGKASKTAVTTEAN
jgi:MFS family permease